MEGVTILAVNEAVEAIRFNWIIAILIFSAAIFIGLFHGLGEGATWSWPPFRGSAWFDFWNSYGSYYKSARST